MLWLNLSTLFQDGDMGITPRSFAHIFEAIKDLVCKVRVSYVEIYEEGIYDLLSAQDDHTKLEWVNIFVNFYFFELLTKIFFSIFSQVYGVKCITIPGLIEIEVLNCNQVSFKKFAQNNKIITIYGFKIYLLK